MQDCLDVRLIVALQGCTLKKNKKIKKKGISPANNTGNHPSYVGSKVVYMCCQPVYSAHTHFKPRATILDLSGDQSAAMANFYPRKKLKRPLT